MLSVFATGRILNQKTANSQAVGAMIWSVGSALHENAAVDPRCGYFVNHDLAEYHVSAHADIPVIKAHFLQEVDDKTKPLKIKGVGEPGICGAGQCGVHRLRGSDSRIPDGAGQDAGRNGPAENNLTAAFF